MCSAVLLEGVEVRVREALQRLLFRDMELGGSVVEFMEIVKGDGQEPSERV